MRINFAIDVVQVDLSTGAKLRVTHIPRAQRVAKRCPSRGASPTARPNRTLSGTPDMISTRAPSRAPITLGVEITSSPLMCSRATVGSRSRNEALRRRVRFSRNFWSVLCDILSHGVLSWLMIWIGNLHLTKDCDAFVAFCARDDP